MDRTTAERTTTAGELILVANEKSGDGAMPTGLFDGFERVTVESMDDALDDADLGPDTLVAVWGGDGTCRSVAQHLAGTQAVLLPCPGGTWNHFARAARLALIDDVEEALHSRHREQVDVGWANDLLFLNNLSIGWYVDLVARRERYERRLPRRAAKVLSSIVQLARTRRTRVTVDGVQERVWMVWVGNGQYSLSPTELAERADLADGVLDLRILRAGHHFPKIGALMTLLLGRVGTSHRVDRRIVASCTLSPAHVDTRVALDGELVRLPGPISVRCGRRQLTIAVP